MNLEDIMLSVISQTKKDNTAWYHFNGELKEKNQPHGKKSSKVIARGWGMVEISRGW